jgi:hypothetical protein
MMIYGNLLRTYNGKRTLWDAAKTMDSLTVRLDMRFGHGIGTYGKKGTPFIETDNQPGAISPEVKQLTQKVNRDILSPLSLLSDLIIESIEKAWKPNAFHLVLHSSGWDSRMMSGAIKTLYKKHGKDWLGDVLFLTNRWEALRFLAIMKAMEWDKDQYTVYDNNTLPDEHYAQHAYDIWRCAPFPRPANFLWYLPAWAEEEGLVPKDNVQVFTGLWANEVWHTFIKDNSLWEYMIRRGYGWSMIASMPIKATWAEYPLVSLPVMDMLRRVRFENGNKLRKFMAAYMNPDAAKVRPRVRISDGYHKLSDRLREELNAHYQQTSYGQRVPWEVPNHSGNSVEWGKWSVALLIEKLEKLNIQIKWNDKGAL